MCANCARGWTSSCLNLDSQVVSGGRSLGFTAGLGGGWGEQALAHASMLFPIPDAVPDRGASLYEPVSIACHGLLRSPPRDGDPVLVVGAGIIGLASLAAVKGLFPGCPVTVLARHEHQAAAAAACGADHVVRTEPGGAHFEELAELTGARVVGRKADLMLMGGFPYVVEAVGAPQSVTEALRAVAHRGTVLLLGAAGVTEVDLTPVWYKEAALVGSIDHTVDSGSAPGPGRRHRRHSVDRALDVLAAGLLPARRGRDPRVRARGVPSCSRDRDRPGQLPRHQGRLSPLTVESEGRVDEAGLAQARPSSSCRRRAIPANRASRNELTSPSSSRNVPRDTETSVASDVAVTVALRCAGSNKASSPK